MICIDETDVLMNVGVECEEDPGTLVAGQESAVFTCDLPTKGHNETCARLLPDAVEATPLCPRIPA